MGLAVALTGVQKSKNEHNLSNATVSHRYFSRVGKLKIPIADFCLRGVLPLSNYIFFLYIYFLCFFFSDLTQANFL